MNAELHTVLAELNSLAMEHGWKRVLTLTDEGYFRTASAQILISAQTETDTTSFQNCDQRTCAGHTASNATIAGTLS